MSGSALRGNRTLLFRLYLLLAVGLVAVAAVLDFGFRALQAELSPPLDLWRDAAFNLLRERIESAAPADLESLAAALTAELGTPVQILAADNVVSSVARTGAAPHELYDSDGRVSWLVPVNDGRSVIRIGPMTLPAENPWLRWIPPLFYLSIFVLVGLWLRPLLRDLDTITASTRAFATDYREPQPTAQSVTSLRELAENFDAMSARLSALIQGQKELTSALSHEMRTPLARIRFALAVIGEKLDAAGREELAAIGADVHEIDRLIATMLNYARLDHPDTQMHWQQTPARAWVAQTVEKSRLPGIDIEVRCTDDALTVTMDVRLMTLALSNLLVNGCRHANQRVRVTLDRVAADNVLCVEDDGSGIPEADRKRVFKAFTRLDGSRNRDTGGYGLGLAIVARIANLHGGSASAGQSAALGGAAMTIRLPVRR